MTLGEIGKTLMVFGLALAGLGALLVLAHKMPFLGKLPGDIHIQRRNFTFYFPLATSLLVSLLVSFLMWLWSKR